MPICAPFPDGTSIAAFYAESETGKGGGFRKRSLTNNMEDKDMATLVRRNQNWLPDIFNDFFDNNWVEKTSNSLPAVNVIEKANEYKVELAAPGLTKEDFDVHIDEDNNLVINVEKKHEENEKTKDGRYLRREFSYSKFQRTLILPDDVDKEKISAKVENGLLNVELPKVRKADVCQRKSIEIK